MEVKNGETFNGVLLKCDIWMNLHLSEVIQTSADGNRFWKLAETFIRGSTIKFVRLPEEVMDNAKELNKRPQGPRRGGQRGRGRGGRGGRGVRGGRDGDHYGDRRQ